MNPGGIVITIVGVWLGCQVFGGNMLERVGILSAPKKSSSASPAVALGPSGSPFGTSSQTTWT